MRVMPWEGSGRYSPGPGMVKLLEKWFYQELRPLMAICSLNPPGNLAIVSELVGNFKNPGRCWRRRERTVLDHDFRRYAVGVGIPYGIYDEGWNAGFVVLGVSHDTAAFAIAAIRQWWLQVGQKHYSKAKRWLIEADGGGSNGTRNWLWKAGLQALADEFQVITGVLHSFRAQGVQAPRSPFWRSKRPAQLGGIEASGSCHNIVVTTD